MCYIKIQRQREENESQSSQPSERIADDDQVIFNPYDAVISSLSKINNSFSYATRYKLQNYKINLLKFFKIIQKYNEETIQISFSSNCSEK